MTNEEPKRLAPTPTVTRNLYAASGNRCAFPGCDSPLMRADGVLVGQIAHIEAASKDGPRFNKDMSNEERRAQANLMIMCATCHKVIDTDVAKWTVQKLQALKAEHEAIYTGAIDLLRRQVGDITEGVTWTPPENLGAVYAPGDLEPDELQQSIEDVNQIAAKMAGIPIGARSVLALVIIRGEARNSGVHWNTEVTIPLALLKQIVDCSESELVDHMNVLEHVGYGWLEEPWDGDQWEYQVGNSTGGLGWKLFADIKRLAAGDAKTIRRVIIDLDFTVLDAP